MVSLDIPDSKILFFIPSPRDIPEVKKPIEELLYNKFDVIWFKYYREEEAYTKLREYFLIHPAQYEYLCILPDDLIINKEGLDELLTELRNPTHVEVEKYQALAGVCNYSMMNEQQREMAAASFIPVPEPERNLPKVVWDGFARFNDLDKMDDKIIQCGFIGFSLMFIHRSVIEKIPFRTTNPLNQYVGADIYFSQDLWASSIPQFIDKKARFLHLRGISATHLSGVTVNPDVLMVGKYKPYIILKNRLAK